MGKVMVLGQITGEIIKGWAEKYDQRMVIFIVRSAAAK